MAIVNFISTIWSDKLLDYTNKKYIGIANCSREYEGEIIGHGSVLKITGIDDSKITISPYTKNEDITAPETLSDKLSLLRINQAKYFNFQIDDVDKLQSSNNKLLDNAIDVASDKLATDADAYVYSLYVEAITTTTHNATTPDTIADTVGKAVVQLMRVGTMTLDDVVIEVSPEIAVLLYKAHLVDVPDTSELGLIGKVCGCKTYVSNNVVVAEDGHHKCIVRTKRAVAFAEQMQVETYRPDDTFATAVKGLHLYGAKIIYPEEYACISLKIAE